MIQKQRQQKIMEYITANGAATVEQLAEFFQVSPMTVRRDLDMMSANGLLTRVRGGAMAGRMEQQLPTYDDRLGRLAKEKSAIGAAAARLITPNSLIAFDGGTTTLAAVRALPSEISFTALTTGIMTAAALCAYDNVNLIQAGGPVHKDTYTVCTMAVNEFLADFRTDIAFISTRGVLLGQGIFESTLEHAEEKRALAKIARRVVILADHTKFGAHSLCLALPISKVDTVITDRRTPEAVLSPLRDQGITVIVADA